MPLSNCPTHAQLRLRWWRRPRLHGLRHRRLSLAGPLLAATLALAGCAPALDWREVRVDGGAASGLLPCKPTVQERKVELAGRTVAMGLQACSAAGQTWALAQADVGDPAQVAAALDELVRSAAANIGAAADASAGPAAPVPGATPNPRARRVALAGRGAGGAPVRMELQVFTLGTRVFQATALGPALDREALDTFFGGLRAHP
jgi:hypothetical protein